MATAQAARMYHITAADVFHDNVDDIKNILDFHCWVSMERLLMR